MVVKNETKPPHLFRGFEEQTFRGCIHRYHVNWRYTQDSWGIPTSRQSFYSVRVWGRRYWSSQ